MADVALKLSKEKLVEGLSDLSFKEIKEIMDSLIRKKLFNPPKPEPCIKKPQKSPKAGNFLNKIMIPAANYEMAVISTEGFLFPPFISTLKV